MTKTDLTALGLTEEDVLNKLVDRLCEQYLQDSEGYKSDFENRIEKAVRERVDEVLEDAMQKHIAPNITAMVDNLCLQETNKWGEIKNEKLTFIEYLTQRVDAYIREDVNHNGKTEDQDSYSWRASSTRIAYMIHEHLQYSIDRAMKDAIGNVNSSVRKGLEEAVKMALAGIKVTVDTRVTS